MAQTVDTANQELLRQQERERALREQQEATPDVRLPAQAQPAVGRIPRDEAPCFPISSIRLDGELATQFQWALKAVNAVGDVATGRCLGTEGINVVMKRAQNAMVARGYVTTRVLAKPQDLRAGVLTLTVVPGRIHAVRFAPGVDARATSWRDALPARPGDLLNLRDIEQALENFKRVPTVEADIKIAPAEGEGTRPGDSDLLIVWKQSSPARMAVTLDDSGSKATGKLQGGVTLSLDNLLTWNDLFYANLGHDVFDGDHKGTRSYTLHYDVPYGYWQLGGTASAYTYHQTVAGYAENYVYSGTSHNADLRLSRMLYRNATIKAGAYARAWERDSNNFIDDTEVVVQRRRQGGWEAGFTYRQFIGAAVLDANAAYRRGTGAFNAMPAPEEQFGEGTSRTKLVTADAQLTVPFQLGDQRLRYIGSWRAQWNQTPLVPQDRFAIGGRYTVRGFDGELQLTGDHGWLVRNDLGWTVFRGQELYLGLDVGHVGGPPTQWELGQTLAGAVIGLRGGWLGLAWDVFAGAPISKPHGFQTANPAAGFSLSWSY
ncbi:ShlB/FhaC/HecB family hemolysin secretion/activation protein [Dyella telluris]|uniref:ShlB/FhaC/HecB family hemolysin secretion/activation protein n=1 Tax=Dyella telluris TaxID=2763498 RepID=A0A7G8Q1L5_9GAMM|nr:ShlB/FhaC/HecB family hemolysin secretion/activation protein [Dyella telluris]QNK00673.1 ShlB/FhaC/HecB family hemolysin secretion/activation protein [Dyella telluris]